MLKIGLTGGIGSGKTTAANYFADLGIKIIDADQIAHQIVKPGSSLLVPIIERFGSEILDQEGNLKRNKLADIIFANANEREWLEKLLHPPILTEMHKLISATTSPYCILVIPLLLEKNLPVDRVLVIDCAVSTQTTRLQQNRQLTLEQINAILATQLPREQRNAKADDIIMNDGSLTDLRQKVFLQHQIYLQIVKGIYVNTQNH